MYLTQDSYITYIKNFCKSIWKRGKPVDKWVKCLNRDLTTEVIQMANRHMRISSTSLGIREMQVETNIRHHCILTIIDDKRKKVRKHQVLVRSWTTGSFHPIGRNVNSYNLGNYLTVSASAKNMYTSWCNNSIPRYTPHRNGSICPPEALDWNGHCKAVQTWNYSKSHQWLHGIPSIMVFPPRGLQLGNESERIRVMHSQMDESHKHRVKESQSALGELLGQRSQARRGIYCVTPFTIAFFPPKLIYTFMSQGIDWVEEVTVGKKHRGAPRGLATFSFSSWALFPSWIQFGNIHHAVCSQYLPFAVCTLYSLDAF